MSTTSATIPGYDFGKESLASSPVTLEDVNADREVQRRDDQEVQRSI